MKIKHLLTLLLTMATLPALAQGSGIKGKVVSRGDRAAIEQVKITLTPGERQATSDAEGRFRFDDVASGDYTLTFEADDYEPLEIKVRVDKLTKDVRSIALVPVYTEAFDYFTYQAKLNLAYRFSAAHSVEFLSLIHI